MHKFLFYNKFIIFLYMFRALLCASSGGQSCIIRHLVSSHSVDGTKSSFVISLLLYACTCFEHYVLIIRRSKLYYTAFGIVTPVGGRPVHRLREDFCARDGHLHSVTMPDAVQYSFDLLMMSTTVLETCRGI